MKKSESLINLDNNSLSILNLNKAELERSALNLKTKLDPLTEFEALYKFKHLIVYRMEWECSIFILFFIVQIR